MRALRVGFLGAGTVARLHARAVADTPGMRLAAVYDPRRERSAALAADHGAEPIASERELAGHAGLDAVFVLGPTRMHVAAARRCPDAGKHVLVEKPVDEDPAAIRELADRARRAGRLAIPAHNYLHLPECARLVRQAREGALGRIRALFITYAIAHPEELAARYGAALAEVMRRSWTPSAAPLSALEDAAEVAAIISGLGGGRR